MNRALPNLIYFIQIHFVLIWDVHLWKYYAPSRAYAREPHQPLRLDFSGINFSSHPRSQLPFLAFCGQAKRTRVKSRRPHERTLLANLPTPVTLRAPPPPTTYFLTRWAPRARRAISFRRALLEEYFPCVAQNIFSLYSPCSSFNIVATCPGYPNPLMGWHIRGITCKDPP